MHILSAHAWDYLPALKTVFESLGLDYVYYVSDLFLNVVWVSSPPQN